MIGQNADDLYFIEMQNSFNIHAFKIFVPNILIKTGKGLNFSSDSSERREKRAKNN
jgi:hypothetical protein